MFGQYIEAKLAKLEHPLPPDPTRPGSFVTPKEVTQISVIDEETIV